MPTPVSSRSPKTSQTRKVGWISHSLPLINKSSALYLSDVLCTSYHAVVSSGLQKGETVAIWGLGPIGLMAAYYCFQKGASRVIAIDNNWRLQFGQSKLPKLEIIDYSKIPSSSSVPTELRKMVDKGVDRAIDCAGGEYAKGILHKVEIALTLETDTSETINECILSVKKFGTIAITGVYAACKWLSFVDLTFDSQAGSRYQSS